MADNVVKLKQKPKKKHSIFTYIIVSVFAFLISIKIFDFLGGESLLQRKHSVQVYNQPINVINSSFQSLKGDNLTFDDFKGRKVLLAFWAPWCQYCKVEFPIIDHLSKQLNDKGYEIVPMVKNTESVNDVIGFYKRLRLLNIPPYISGDRELYEKLHIRGFPSFILVNEDGMAVAKMHPKWESGDIMKLFDELDQYASAKKDPVSFPNP